MYRRWKTWLLLSKINRVTLAAMLFLSLTLCCFDRQRFPLFSLLLSTSSIGLLMLFDAVFPFWHSVFFPIFFSLLSLSLSLCCSITIYSYSFTRDDMLFLKLNENTCFNRSIQLVHYNAKPIQTIYCYTTMTTIVQMIQLNFYDQMHKRQNFLLKLFILHSRTLDI